MFGRQKNEIALIRAYQRGDTQSFEIIVERYQSLLCAITYSDTGSLEHSEELAQEIFLLAWKNIKDLRNPAKFHSWLCTIARNTVQNWRRRCARRREGQAVPLTAVVDQPAETADPSETIIQEEQEAVINQALEQIPTRYREALILFYRENKSTRRELTISIPVRLTISHRTNGSVPRKPWNYIRGTPWSRISPWKRAARLS